MKLIAKIKIDNTWTVFWITSSIFLAFSLLPFILNNYPGMADYPNHLARVHLLTDVAKEGWQQFFTVKHEIVANLALDLIASGLVKLGFTPEVALKIFAALSYILLVIGAYSVACVTNKNPPWLIIWVFIFAFNRYFIWGFLNYFFSVGLALILFAFWIKAKSFSLKKQRVSECLISILLIFVLISHLMGYGIALLCIFIYELCLIYDKRNWSTTAKHLFKISLYFIPSVLFYFFVCQHGDNHDIVYQNVLRSKISGLLSPFLSYSLKLSALFMLTFLGSLIYLRKTLPSNEGNPSKVLATRLYAIPIILFLLSLVLPSAMMGSYYLDKRIFVIALILAVSLTNLHLQPKHAIVIVVIGLSSLIIKLTEVNSVWQTYSSSADEITQALDKIKPNSKIESYSYGDDEMMPVPPLQHMVSFAAFLKGAFVPTLFAKPINEESIAFKTPYDKRAYTTGTYVYKDSLVIMRYVCDYHQQASYYDYVLVTFMTKKPRVPACLALVTSGQHFNLYKVNNIKLTDQQLN